MKYVIAGLCCAWALAGAETAEQRGNRVVQEALAALGGEQFLNLQDRVEDGRAYSFYRDQLTGLAKAKISTRNLPAEGPNKLAQVERQAFGKDEDHLILFTESRGYQVTFRGAKPLPEDRQERYRESTRRGILYILRHRLKEPGLIIEGKGADVWQNTPVEVVDITDAENRVLTVYFNRHTKLPLRQVYITRDPKTKDRDEFSTTFAKYRDVGNGIQWPYHVRSERNGEKTFELFSEVVTVNQNLSPELFQLGSGLKVLPADK
ncbi:MAG TPA: hypothetical protein VES20_09935 [Bryobacteraceae bacterium]|nr:hypothetical protein [Bryobacteraceae bacterium]